MPEDREQKRGIRGVLSPRLWRRLAAESPQLFLRLGIAIAAFMLLVVAPGYISFQPKFLERYANMDTEYENWSTSAHAQVACRQCHVPPRATAQVAYGARMLGEFYLSFVAPSRQPRLFAAPSNEACADCHIDLRTVSPSGDLNIPHRAHVSVLKLKCVQCHSYLVHKATPEGKHVPRMADCMKSCHDGVTAKNECSACHTEKVEPFTHRKPDWLVVHAAAGDDPECRSCHKWTEKWCSNCHDKKPRSHTAAWRADHREQVEKRRNCEACHKPAFCVKCHGEVPARKLNPKLELVDG